VYGFVVAILNAPYIYKDHDSCDVVCYGSRLSQILSSFVKDQLLIQRLERSSIRHKAIAHPKKGPSKILKECLAK
jgi:hypothetical protein